MNKITYVSYKRLLYILCLLLCGSVSACKYDDLSVKKPNENFRLADEFLKNNYDYSIFYAALQYTGLTDTLHKQGMYTVIAPNNKAFIEIGIQRPEDVYKLNRDSLRQAMAYHIIPRKLVLENLPVNGVDVRYETLAGAQLYMSLASFSPNYPEFIRNYLYYSGSSVYRKDVPLANGALQGVDKVMKQHPDKTVQGLLGSKPEYSIFVAGLKKFGLWDELAQPDLFTVFAPENKAFEKAGITEATINALNTADYFGPRLFGAYIMYGKNYFLSDMAVFTTINDQSNITLTPRNDSSKLTWFGSSISLQPAIGSSWYYRVYFEPSDLAKSDNICTNGIVHNLPAILVKPENARK